MTNDEQRARSSEGGLHQQRHDAGGHSRGQWDNWFMRGDGSSTPSSTKQRATTAKLEPGENTIDRGRPIVRTVDGRSVVVLDWTVRLHDGRTLRRRTKGESETVVRRRARAKAEQLLASTAPERSPLQALAQQIADLSADQRAQLDELVEQLTA